MRETSIEDPRYRDITGDTFGHLTAIRYDHKGKHRTYWLCRCDCGKECFISRQNLISGKTRSCGHLRANSRAITRGHFRKRDDITDQQKAWIIKHYIHTKNDDIKRKFGLTDGWLHRFARAHGLKKSPQFVHKCQIEAAQKAYASHKLNGTFPPKGYQIPNSGAAGFKPGVPHKETKKQKEQRIAKATATMHELRLRERARMRLGFPRLTKLNVTIYPDSKRRIVFRHNLRRRGYIIERGSDIAYYDENTKRSARIEGRKAGDRFYVSFEFRPKAAN
ncbi:MAG: hypothetical protein J6W74_00235 [Bacteroidales bacterium]|nr:hypothetical protein [Bacteroidales bacterium]MBP5689322.1 hypothetical protein [Bacteroidales bacterium]